MPDRGEQHRPLKVWQAVAFLEPAVLLELAEAAEASGFFGIMVSDHLVYPGVLETRYPRSRSADGAPGWDPATPWPDPWVAIAAMAARTTSLQFGTNICVAPTWNIFRLAKQVSTAAVLSAGRVRLGVGAGWMREEFDCAGTDFANRGARLDELLAAVRALWGPDWVEFHGTFYDFGPLRLSPRPTGTIPIDCGGHGRRGLRRAARHGDGWIGGAYDDDELDALLAILDEELAAVGRSGDTAFEVVATPDAVPEADTYRRWADKGLTGVIVPPTALCGDDAPSRATRDRLLAGLEQLGRTVISKLG